MNEDTIKGNWKQFKGKMVEQWGKLTDDDFDVIAGRREQLLGKLQERQGLARDAAEKQLKDWQARHPTFHFND
ncbi:MAG: CsbD family protein [Acidovorax sp.]|nr:CsbD family protein [Acidovorax sp.]